jgi:DNA-binding SARP family transcriptional activator
MTTILVHLFGRFSAHCGETAANLEGRKTQDLFCYLLLYRDTPHTREHLATQLWGDCSTSQSKSYLRKALWQLQSALDSLADARRILFLEDAWVQISPEADLWLDVSTFEAAYRHVQGIPGADLSAEYFDLLKSAVNLYRGDLLLGCYEEWCLLNRERLQGMYLAMLDKLMGYCEVHQDYESGIEFGTRVLNYDQARERTHQRLMRLHYQVGDRTAALRQYEACAALLQRELNVSPDEYTIKLYQQIRANQPINLDSLTTKTPMDRSAKASLSDLFARLQALQAALADAQDKLKQELQSIERLINP